jgi:hypothetical protein
MSRGLDRRRFMIGGLALGATTAIGGAGLALGVPDRIRRQLQNKGPDGAIPAVPEGRIAVEQVDSVARARRVGLWTAVPDGHGAGRGLPVCLILHGGSATTADYRRFGFGRFLTAAVRSGVPPFVLVGADGGHNFWQDDGAGDDPQRMLRDELPRWCTQRGFDAGRMAAYGWSMGGYGALLLAERPARPLAAVAALSPAVQPGDPVFGGVARLDGARTALWCGRSDQLLPAVQRLARSVPGGPAIAAWADGAHTRGYWNRVTPAAFVFVGRALG